MRFYATVNRRSRHFRYRYGNEKEAIAECSGFVWSFADINWHGMTVRASATICIVASSSTCALGARRIYENKLTLRFVANTQ